MNSHLCKGVNQECLSVHENQDAPCSVFGQYRTPNSDDLMPADPQWVIVRRVALAEELPAQGGAPVDSLRSS
jgi:hypothetical protein